MCLTVGVVIGVPRSLVKMNDDPETRCKRLSARISCPPKGMYSIVISLRSADSDHASFELDIIPIERDSLAGTESSRYMTRINVASRCP